MGSIFITFAVAINLIACNGNNNTPKELSVLTTLLYFTAQGGEQPLNFSVSWEITNIPSWISFSKTLGTGNQNIIVETNVNELNEYRNEILKIITNNGSVDLDIRQQSIGIYPNYNTSPIDQIYLIWLTQLLKFRLKYLWAGI